MDLILSLIVDGSAEGAQSAKLPLALRILLAAVVIVFFGGAAALLLACGLLVQAGAAVRLLCLALGAACAVYLALFLRRLARGLRE